MGTQQILLVVLSVIIVGVAVAVGITMFGSQSENSNRQAVLADLQSFGSSAMMYYKTPLSMGGGGNGSPGFVLADVSKYIGFAAAGTFSNDNGSFVLTRTSATVIKIVGTGTQFGHTATAKVKATLTITATNASPLAIVIDN